MFVFSRVIILFTLLFSCFLTAQAAQNVKNIVRQGIIHHDILAQLTPEKNQVNIIDVISFGKSKTSILFLLHEGKMPLVKREKAKSENIKISKLTDADLALAYPAFANRKTTGNVPVAAYKIESIKPINKVTLEYTLKINHTESRIGRGGKRSIVESSGVIIPQGVYLGGESLWYPRIADELVNFRLSVRLPSGWKSVSQGERKYVEDEKTYHLDVWEEKNAQDDIYLIAAKFTEYSQSAGNVKAMAFLREPDEAMAKKYLDATAQYLAMYQRLLGSYPYQKFALVENFWQTGFGMPSFTLLGSRIIRFPFILYSSYPHELLHNWWGNSVYVNYEEGNWAEGLTAYLADHLIKEQRGKGASHRRAVLQKYTNFTQADGDFPLSDFVSRNDAVTEAVGYGKTMMMFHMLRRELGDEVFTQGLKSFYSHNRYQVAAYTDINAAFSKAAGKDLTSFFKQWVTRTGAPDLKLLNVVVKKMPNGKYRLTAKVTQQKQGSAYVLNIPVAVYIEGEKAAFQKTLLMKGKSLLIDLVFDGKPVAIDIDPEFDVFRRLDFNEIPPSVSQVFGSAESLILISNNETPELKRGYEMLAKSWQASQSGNISIGFDSDFNRLPDDKSVWLLGVNNKFKPAIMTSLKDYPFSESRTGVSLNEKQLDFNENTIVLISRNPANPKFALAYVSVDKAIAVSGLGRKLPHYGKYSYLAFKGDAPTNVTKGQWPIIHSPLSVKLSASKSAGQLASRPPLIQPSL